MRDKSKFKFKEGYKIECCEKHDPITLVLNEKNLLEDTVSELNENSFLQEQHVNRLKKEHAQFIEEVSLREEELNALIRNQEEIIRNANRELEILRNDILKLTGKSFSSHATQTAYITFCSSESQTENDQMSEINQTSSNVIDSLPKSSDNPIKTHQKNLILIAGDQGKELVHFLRDYVTDFSVSSIIKTNATNHELVLTAIKYSRHLSNEDYLVLWPNENSSHLFEKLHSHLIHKNFFILNTPNRYDSVILNKKIYHSNLSLDKKVYNTMGNLDCLINVNNILRISNYGYKANYISKTGKRFIALHLANKITGDRSLPENNIMKNRLNPNNKTEKIVMPAKSVTNYISESPDSGSSVELSSSRCLAEELNITSPFLYPRLSQLTFEN